MQAEGPSPEGAGAVLPGDRGQGTGQGAWATPQQSPWEGRENQERFPGWAGIGQRSNRNWNVGTCPGCGDSARRAQGSAQALLVLTGARGLCSSSSSIPGQLSLLQGSALRLKPPNIPEHTDIGKPGRVSLRKARTAPFQHRPAFHTHHSITSHYQKHLFLPRCSNHQHTFQPYYFSSQGLNTACIKLLHYCLLPGSLSWLSHVFPGSKSSCSWKPCSKHMFLHGMFIIIFRFILLVHVLLVCVPKGLLSAGFVQSCLIGFRLLCEFIQCQAQALNPCQVIHHFSLKAMDRILLLACQIKA